PGLGAAVASAVSLYILTACMGHDGLPRIVKARMAANYLLDSLISAVPIVGNLWDAWFKADTRNVQLLREYAGATGPASTWRHWVFVLSAAGAALLVASLLAAGVVLLVSAASG